MFRRSKYLNRSEEANTWQAFTDLISNMFIIISLILLLALVKSTLEKSQLKKEIETLKSAPPVLLIQNSGEYKFQSGSAVLPPALRNYIRGELTAEIEKITQTRGIYIVEIIGHTDGQPINSCSNLDTKIENLANGKESIERLKPGSNADLGLMRALQVVKELQQTGKLKQVQFRAYSAGQLILPDGNFAKVDRTANATRRRIEIRFSPLGEAKTIK